MVVTLGGGSLGGLCVLGGVEYVLACYVSTCGGVHVCECEHMHVTACMEIREQPWMLVLIFPCSLLHTQAGCPPLNYIFQMVCFM